jgi:hypothetical protein
MISVIKATEEKDILLIANAMPLVKLTNFKVLYGFFEDGKCVGGMWLSSTYPHEMSVEYSSKSLYTAKAFAEVFSGLFTVVPTITGNIRETNFSCLKMARQFGFKQIYNMDGFVKVELTPESYTYKKKYPLSVSR